MNVEWIILADGAEVVNNKLYLLGGGWDSLTVNSGFPHSQSCAVAVAYRVPWNETNQQHEVQVEIVDEDGGSLASITGQIEVGRPVGIPIGSAQRVQMAVTMNLGVEKPGTYSIIAKVEGQEVERSTFNVFSGQPFGDQRRSARPSRV